MSSKAAIVVTGADLAPEARALLGDYELVFAGKTPTEDDVSALCEHFQPVAILLRYGKVTDRILAASPKLRVVSKHGSGTDTIDAQAAKARNVAIRAAAGANADAVAEHAWALILACAKNVVGLDARMRAGHWDKATHKSLELAGKTLGLVGLGAIGQRVATIALAMRMKVIAFDPFVKAPPAGVEMASLDDVFARSQVLSLHCPLTDENRNLVNRARLASMPDGAILVNTGRGGLIDEDALREALASGKLRAAGLDTFATEPLSGEHAWRNVERTVLSPHIGGVSEDAYVNMGVGAARNILAVLEG